MTERPFYARLFQLCSKFIAWCTCPCILSFLPLLPLCQELRTHIPHALLAQPEKYGTVTATVLPDWTGTLMRRLTALIQAASTATSDVFFFVFFIHLEDPPPLCSYMCICFVVFHVFNCARSECSAPLCRWRNLQGENHQRAIALLDYKLFAGSEGTLILLISTSTLTAGTRATQTCHCLSSADIQAF